MVSLLSLSCCDSVMKKISLNARLRRSYPNFINTSGLLVDVVSVMSD
jgi:hypothetical protein